MPGRERAWSLDERRLRLLVENASDVITVVEFDLRVVFQTESGARLLGYHPDELLGTKFAALVDPEGLARLRAACAGVADGMSSHPVPLALRHRDGHWLDCETVVRYEPEAERLVLTTRDIRERKRAEELAITKAAQQAVVADLGTLALRGEELVELMLHAASEVASTLDADYAAIHEYVPAHHTFMLKAGVGMEAFRRATVTIAAPGSLLGLTLDSLNPVIVRDWAEESYYTEASLATAHGVSSGIAAQLPGTHSPFGAISVYVADPARFNYGDGVFLQTIANTLAAAIERSEHEEKVRHQALHDALTGLPNRILFEDRLTRALTTANRRGRRLAVLFLDLDNFKWINDSLGHATGDQVLGAVAKRIADSLRAEDTLARFGGDEFVVLLPEIEGDEDSLAVVNRIRDSLRAPVDLGGYQIVTSVSAGIAIGGAAEMPKDATALVRDADLAMYAAKQRGPRRAELFAEHMYDAAVQRLDLTGDLYRALERGELRVHYQPIVTLLDEAIVGFEALVRWDHPRHGLLPPGAFLPLAEETGLILSLGRLVLREACEQLRKWRALPGPRYRDLHVSVNLSAQDIHSPDLVANVASVLAETGLPPGSLILEITEGVLIKTDDEVSDRLRELTSMGVALAVDDFGTGYSALSSLRRFPINVIKIDKSFTEALGEVEQDRLVRGIVELAHGIDLKTIAEGVETAEQADALRELNSEFGQGFHFAKPLSSDEVDALLSAAGDPPIRPEPAAAR